MKNTVTERKREYEQKRTWELIESFYSIIPIEMNIILLPVYWLMCSKKTREEINKINK